MRRFQALVILLVCCFVSSAFVGCGAQKEEPAMKTFENKNLSVSLPNGWSIGEDMIDLDEVVSIRLEQPEKSTNNTVINIMIRKNFTMPDLPSKPGSERINERIGGIDFVVFKDNRETEDKKIDSYYGKKNRDIIAILTIYSKNNKEMVERIIETLNFK